MSLSLNDLRASSVRLLTPWTGVWSADVDVDLGERAELPTGPAILRIGTSTLVGTIDPAQSGRFGLRARARVVAGAGGWEKNVEPQHYKNDGGVVSTAVFATTAALVGERVVEAQVSRFGIDFVRAAGPAARVLAGLSWYVDATGTTIVGPRPELPAPPSLRVLDWNAQTKVATIASEDPVLPGTLLSDPRFGTAKIRDVEQTWADGGARATAWTVAATVDPTPRAGAGGGELVGLVAAIAREASGTTFATAARYRVDAQSPDGRLTLTAVETSRRLPDLKLISLAPAVPGMKVTVPPGAVAHVEFIDGDQSKPVVTRFEEGTPISVTFDASTIVHVGGVAPTAGPVAMATGTLAAFAAFLAWAQAVSKLPGPFLATEPLTQTLTAALATAAAATPIPSTKLTSQ